MMLCTSSVAHDAPSHFFLRRYFHLDFIIATHLARLRQRNLANHGQKSIYTIRIDDRFRLDFFFFFHLICFPCAPQEIKIRYLNNLNFMFETNERKKKNFLFILIPVRATNVEQLYCSMFNFEEKMPKLRRDARVEMILCINKCERKRVRRKTSTADTPEKKIKWKCSIIIHFV